MGTSKTGIAETAEGTAVDGGFFHRKGTGDKDIHIGWRRIGMDESGAAKEHQRIYINHKKGRQLNLHPQVIFAYDIINTSYGDNYELLDFDITAGLLRRMGK